MTKHWVVSADADLATIVNASDVLLGVLSTALLGHLSRQRTPFSNP